jgi:hypothetical protein
VFSKTDREAVMRCWPPVTSDPKDGDAEALCYCVPNFDPSIISLKSKMMHRPTLYDVSFSTLVSCFFNTDRNSGHRLSRTC